MSPTFDRTLSKDVVSHNPFLQSVLNVKLRAWPWPDPQRASVRSMNDCFSSPFQTLLKTYLMYPSMYVCLQRCIWRSFEMSIKKAICVIFWCCRDQWQKCGKKGHTPTNRCPNVRKSYLWPIFGEKISSLDHVTSYHIISRNKQNNWVARPG